MSITVILAKPPPNPALDAFIDEFWAATTAHPFNRKVRLLPTSPDAFVQLEVRPFDGHILLSSVQASPQGEGQGTAAMGFLMDLAVKHGVSLKGTAQAYSQKTRAGDATKRLRGWYERLGFRIGAGDPKHGYDIEFDGCQ